MKNDSKVCLTTYVYGEKYQLYIPMLLYSCYKAYPEYDVTLFIHGKLNKDVRKSIDRLELKNQIIIKENSFNDCPKISALKSKALRWILWDNNFINYDYLYTVDIDMFYIREPIALHVQHVQHMKFLGLPFSNLLRIHRYNPFYWVTMGIRLKHAGFKSFFKFLLHSKVETKLTGLHFVDIKNYYSLFTEEFRSSFKNDIYSGNYLRHIKYPNNEIYLSKIVNKIGIDTSGLGIETNSVNMLDFTNPKRFDFRPHHGLHMGVFRSDSAVQESKDILNSDAYMFYIEKFKETILSDIKFIELSKLFDKELKNQFSRMLKYYNISI